MVYAFVDDFAQDFHDCSQWLQPAMVGLYEIRQYRRVCSQDHGINTLHQ